MQNKAEVKEQRTRDSILPRLMNQKGVAAFLGKSEFWCERMRWSGGGPKFRKIGGHVVYEEQDLLAWLNEHPKLTSTSDTGEVAK